jgi:hypothetical protein
MAKPAFIGPLTLQQTRRKTKAKKKSRGKRSGRPRPKVVNGGWAYGNARSRGAAQGLPKMASRPAPSAAFCCDALNPFSPSCRGMKWPDGNNGQSIPIQFRGRLTLTLSSQGAVSAAISGNLPYGLLLTASVAGGSSPVYTYNTVYTSYNEPTIFASNAANYRLVCWGVRINVTSAVPNTSGTLILTTQGTMPAVSATYTSGTMDGLDVTAVPLATGKEYLWVSRPLGAGAYLYKALTSNGAVNNDWTTLLLDAYGGPTSSPYTTIEIEYCLNAEFTVSSTATAGLAHLAPKDPPAAPRVIQTIQTARQKMPHVHEGGTDTFAKVAESAVRSAAGWAMDAFGEMAMGML